MQFVYVFLPLYFYHCNFQLSMILTDLNAGRRRRPEPVPSPACGAICSRSLAVRAAASGSGFRSQSAHHLSILCYFLLTFIFILMNRTKAILFTLVRAFEFELAVPIAEMGNKGNAIVQRPIVLTDKAAGNQLPLLVKAVAS